MLSSAQQHVGSTSHFSHAYTTLPCMPFMFTLPASSKASQLRPCKNACVHACWSCLRPRRPQPAPTAPPRNPPTTCRACSWRLPSAVAGTPLADAQRLTPVSSSARGHCSRRQSRHTRTLQTSPPPPAISSAFSGSAKRVGRRCPCRQRCSATPAATPSALINVWR